MTKEQFENLRAKQDLSDLHYPEAKEWMWDYCLFLGKFTDSKGKNYDLGVHYNEHLVKFNVSFSDATVFDNNAGSYSSGFMDYETKVNGTNETKLEWYKRNGFESQVECWNRLQKLLKTVDKI